MVQWQQQLRLRLLHPPISTSRLLHLPISTSRGRHISFQTPRSLPISLPPFRNLPISLHTSRNLQISSQPYLHPGFLPCSGRRLLHPAFSPASSRCLHTSPPCCKPKKGKLGGGGIVENWKKKYRNLVVDREDRDKMPSELEIAKKQLPANTPTLGERMDRDVYRLFHQSDEKHGYYSHRKGHMTVSQEVNEQLKQDLKTRPWQSFKENFAVVREEIKKFDAEVRETVKNPAKNITDWLPMPGERKTEWGFQTEAEVDQWVLSQDSDWGEGYSAARLDLSPLGHAVLSGDLSTRVPADGRTQNAGYVNIASIPRKRSFGQEEVMDHWQEYSHLTCNIRGDGRKYMLNLKVKRDFDVLWNDRWHYPLYTRGGPYWQYVKIPWSKFFLGSRGVLQDKQSRVLLEAGVVGMSITLMDGTSGPFQLEIKDISLHCDHNCDEEDFAYEMYKIPEFWAGH